AVERLARVDHRPQVDEVAPVDRAELATEYAVLDADPNPGDIRVRVLHVAVEALGKEAMAGGAEVGRAVRSVPHEVRGADERRRPVVHRVATRLIDQEVRAGADAISGVRG